MRGCSSFSWAYYLFHLNILFESAPDKIIEKYEAAEKVLEWIDKMRIFLAWLFIALIVILGVVAGYNSCK